MQAIYPLNIDVPPLAPVARWRPLVNWLLVVPLQVWYLILLLGASTVVILGWFTILLTGRLPDSWSDYLMAVLRYGWRVTAYLLAWTDQYPDFSPVAGHVDPGDYPAVLYCARPLARNRLTVLLRAVLVLPHLVVLCAISATAFVVLVAGWLTLLLTGRWPHAVRGFLIGWLRWTYRVQAYSLLVTDVYPPFGFGS